MIVGRYYLDAIPHKEAPLWWQEQGLSYTASGYGRKIPTHHMVKIPGQKSVWRRVYCCQISNAGTCYVLLGKDWIVIE